MTKYVIIDPDMHSADFFDSQQTAVDAFGQRIEFADRNDNMILIELKMPKNPGVPKARIIAVRSKGYVIGRWPPKKSKQ